MERPNITPQEFLATYGIEPYAVVYTGSDEDDDQDGIPVANLLEEYHQMVQTRINVDAYIPTPEEVKAIALDYDGLSNRTMIRWPIPDNATKNKAFHDGIMWAINRIRSGS